MIFLKMLAGPPQSSREAGGSRAASSRNASGSPMLNPGAAFCRGRQTGDRDTDRHNMLNIYSRGYGGEREKEGQRERREEIDSRRGETGRQRAPRGNSK